MLTVKSDDVVGRVKAYEKIVKGENIPEPGVPESFKVLLKELQSIGLDVKILNEDQEEVVIKELDDDDDGRDEQNEDEIKEVMEEGDVQRGDEAIADDAIIESADDAPSDEGDDSIISMLGTYDEDTSTDED